MINKLSKQRTTNRKRKGKGVGSGLGKTAGRGNQSSIGSPAEWPRNTPSWAIQPPREM